MLKVTNSIHRIALIPTINPKYIWGVQYTPASYSLVGTCSAEDHILKSKMYLISPTNSLTFLKITECSAVNQNFMIFMG